MTVSDLITALEDLGATLVVTAGRLRYRGQRLPADAPIRAAIDGHRGELITLLTPAPANPGVRVNPGVLMTLGHVHGYPRLPLAPGVSIVEGYTAWRALTRFATENQRLLAVQAARVTWSSDPMTNDLMYSEPDCGADTTDDNPQAVCCAHARPCANHFDDVFEAYRNGQEERHPEHGPAGGSAA